MRYYLTSYRLDDRTFNEELAAHDPDDLFRRLAERGLGERAEDLNWSASPRTRSTVALFDEGKYMEAAHGACQMLRFQNDSRRALKALDDHGLVHMLIHLAIFPDEPVVTYRRQAVRDELHSLENRIRPGLNT